MSRGEALAIRAYLATVQPVHHEVVSNQLPFPYNIRASLAGWNWFFFTSGRFQPVTGKSAEWNRGAYLVQGPGHCRVCHTAKDFLGADNTDHALQERVLQGWFAPNLTGGARTGLGGWSVEDIAEYLKTGHNRITAATGPMAEVVVDSTSQVHDTDLRNRRVLEEPPAQDHATQPVAATDAVMRAGQAIFADQCAAWPGHQHRIFRCRHRLDRAVAVARCSDRGARLAPGLLDHRAARRDRAGAAEPAARGQAASARPRSGRHTGHSSQAGGARR